MAAERVPDLNWPKNLYRDAVAVDLVDDPDNPFVERDDFFDFLALWRVPAPSRTEAVLA